MRTTKKRLLALLCASLMLLAAQGVEARKRRKHRISRTPPAAVAAPVVAPASTGPIPAAPTSDPSPPLVAPVMTPPPAEAINAPPPGAPESAPQSAPGTSLFAPPAPSALKSGRFMVNLRIGPAIGLKDIDSSFLLSPEFGVAILPEYKGYLIAPLAFQFGSGYTLVQIPLGFQYDLALPVPGLFLTPRVTLGYAALIINSQGSTGSGVFTPELGAKYVFRKRWNFGAELISFPILFGSTLGTLALWRLQFYAGANF